MFALINALVLAQGASETAPKREPARPLTVDDSLRRIEDVAGRVMPVPDVDGDGTTDFVVERGKSRDARVTIDLVTFASSTPSRTLCYLPARSAHATAWDAERAAQWTAWDAGGDIDGDGIPDLVVGFADENAEAGLVVGISGKTGERRWEIRGDAKEDRFGYSIAFAGDIDKDGCADVAVGAVQTDPRVDLADYRAVVELTDTAALHKRMRAKIEANPAGAYDAVREFNEATTNRLPEERRLLEDRMKIRSREPGFVSIHSGKTGTELFRARGAVPGHAFGMRLCAIGDVDRRRATSVLVQSASWSSQPVVVFDLEHGQELARVAHQYGPVGLAGDLNGDQVPDLFLDQGWVGAPYTDFVRNGKATFVSGESHGVLFSVDYPDELSKYGVTVAMGDMDEDGFDDFALGEPNFNIASPGGTGDEDNETPDLRNITLQQALSLVSEAWCAFTWESGCTIIYSGRTHAAIAGVWATPGTRYGLGLDVASVPDVNRDGHRDFLVTDEHAAYVFAGPLTSVSPSSAERK